MSHEPTEGGGYAPGTAALVGRLPDDRGGACGRSRERVCRRRSGSGPPTAIGTGGAAASVERLATEAAIDILTQGGNAVDAAVAAAAVLGVTEPFSAGIGGGGFMVVRTRRAEGDDDRPSRDGARGDDSDVVLGERRAAPVRRRALQRPLGRRPGHVRGWANALERYGTMTFEEVLARRSTSRSHGFVIDQTFFDQTQQPRPLRRHPRDSRAVPRSGRNAPRRGHRLHEPGLAATYARIAHLGLEGLLPRRRRGRARRDGAASGRQSDRQPHWRPGVITMRDLHDLRRARARADTRDYRGVDVYWMGPPSSGGSTVGEALNILEGYDLSRCPAAGAALLSWRRRATRSPTATRTSPTPRTSTSRSPGCCRRATRRRGGR